MAQIFLSYSKPDRALAERFVRALQAEGFTVWWDDDLHPRTSWDRMIEAELEAAQTVLVLWTTASVQSDWVKSEADFALQSDPPKLVQVRIGGCRVPLGFNRKQYLEIDAQAPDRSAAWPKLKRWLNQDVSSSPPPSPSQVRPAGPRSSARIRPDNIRYDVILLHAGRPDDLMIATIAKLFGVSLREARQMYANPPVAIAFNVVEDFARMAKRELESFGAEVELIPVK